MVRILIIDDHRIFGEALALGLSSVNGFTVAGVATNLTDGERLVNSTRPDMILADVNLPHDNVFEFARDVRMGVVVPRIVLLSAHCTDAMLEHAVRVPVDGYLLKTEPFDFLISAILGIAAGDKRYSASIAERLITDPHGNLRLRVSNPMSDLSERQLEVLRHLARGTSVKEVAKLMHLSAKTIDSHKYRIMQRLDIHDRVELAHFAREQGLFAN